MEIVIKRPFETFEDIDDAAETRRLKRFARIKRTLATATDDQHRPLQIAPQQTPHLAGEFRVDLPIRRLLPGHMLGPDRMANVHVFDFGPAIKEQRLWIGLQEGMSGNGIEMLHWLI